MIYVEPVGTRGSIIGIYKSLYFTDNRSRNLFFNVGSQRYLDTAQSGDFFNVNKQNIAELSYQNKGRHLTFKPGIGIEQFKRNLSKRNRSSVTQFGVNYFPHLDILYRFSESSSLNFSYQGSVQLPNIDQVQPINDYTDSLNIFVGNPTLKPEINNSFNVGYDYLSTNNQNVLSTILQVNIVRNQIISQTVITGTSRFMMPVNAKGGGDIRFSTSYSFCIIPHQLNMTTGINLGVKQYISSTNNAIQDIFNYNGYSFCKVVITPSPFFNGLFTYTYNHNSIKKVGLDTKYALQTHVLAHKGSIKLPFDFLFSYYINYSKNIGYVDRANNDQKFIVLNASVTKIFRKPANFSVSLKLCDLLNNYPSMQRTFADNYFEDQSFNRVGRYILLSASYRFNRF